MRAATTPSLWRLKISIDRLKHSRTAGFESAVVQERASVPLAVHNGEYADEAFVHLVRDRVRKTRHDETTDRRDTRRRAWPAWPRAGAFADNFKARPNRKHQLVPQALAP